PDVNTVVHLVRGQRALEFLDNFLARRKIDNRDRPRRFFETIQVLEQFKNAAVVESQSFPDRIAPLYHRIEGTHPGLVAVHQLTVDVDDQVFVFRIKCLLHLESARTTSTKGTKNKL